jgi:hypothetical protein
MHLVGFTVEKYHDARSHERQKCTISFPNPDLDTKLDYTVQRPSQSFPSLP